MPPHTPPPASYIRQASTVSKARFFDAFDLRVPGESLQRVVKTLQFEQPTFTFHPRTCERWLRQRRMQGFTLAVHRQGKSHKKASKLLDSDLDRLLQASSKVRSQPLPIQLEFHGITLSKRAVEVQLRKRRKARRYKKAWVRAVSKINQKKRVIHCQKYKDENLNFWYNKHFSDEAHIDPSQSSAEWILREEGTRLNPENMQMEHFDSSFKVHIAATISIHHKGALQFYNDEPAPTRPRKPRRSKYKSEAEYHQEVLEWQASLPPKKGERNNAMTQKYYVQRLLPIYVQEIQQHIERGLGHCQLQQDNDNSHGTRSEDNLVKQYLRDHRIEIFEHPPQSPDLNPIEACWNILKQRVRRRYFDWHTLEQFKQVILEEWDKITMDEIRARIAELPLRYNKVIERDGFPFKSKLW
jgi:DDE superfamily endonuclease